MSGTLFAQQRFNIELWKKTEGSKKLMPLTQRDFKEILDSVTNSYKSEMPVTIPNSFGGNLPVPKLIGNNGNGHNIYTLPLDNMPMIKPDSTYFSNMPVAGYWRRKTAQ